MREKFFGITGDEIKDLMIFGGGSSDKVAPGYGRLGRSGGGKLRIILRRELFKMGQEPLRDILVQKFRF